ncbi:uncharacterized protein I303_103433 [Kwoniella dejecticola CBS 10117]|uniref:Uncharacterized protein n=1 Tax=Kwoniella dejecticola CBS 10117 TaxID=1296121 RepID=A0A1A6A6R1_9TREE|nr:uncharacterized protein I303_03455 [Kwoniella dejecticola CBS 10117]OBR85744.1 hypothetical protein I303_03455 [Kwoniella dejecticola CBS 10117]
MSGPSNAFTSKRRPSLPSDSSETIVSQLDKPIKPRSSAFVKHGKYVLLGAFGCWYTDLPNAVRNVLGDEGGWIRKVMLVGLSAHAATILIFLYLVLFLPWFRGYIPNYPKWQTSARLKVIVPLLTTTILLGWTCIVVSLSQAGKRSILHSAVDAVKAVGNANLEQMEGERGLGVFRSMAGTTALFTLTLGVLGFIPAPANVPIREKRA